jgi:hypothetical protein
MHDLSHFFYCPPPSAGNLSIYVIGAPKVTNKLRFGFVVDPPQFDPLQIKVANFGKQSVQGSLVGERAREKRFVARRVVASARRQTSLAMIHPKCLRDELDKAFCARGRDVVEVEQRKTSRSCSEYRR